MAAGGAGGAPVVARLHAVFVTACQSRLPVTGVGPAPHGGTQPPARRHQPAAAAGAAGRAWPEAAAVLGDSKGGDVAVGARGIIALITIGGAFFFQAEDGIRDWSVTGVQTCALPICAPGRAAAGDA